MRLLLVAAALVACAAAHEHHGEAPICAGGGGRVVAEFRPGEVTLDGHPADWEAVEASEFALLPALDPDDDKAYTGGKVAVKAVHDGVNVFFMLQVDGDYAYTKGESKKCPSVALMFQVGEKATYYNLLVGTRVLPGLGRRLYGKEGVGRGRTRGGRRLGAVVRVRGGDGDDRRRLGFSVPAPRGAGQ
ncbi:hypothetical protein TRIUR3_11959 [Triticum urartu]|uniref:Cytochrome c-552/DMSO reductase-like haem-binding domain-containing protein n=1 Tax=Triticum urartu TaxID=4572 RepID=M7ZXI1_TRIUA|nr:hypothetical protein TRIUR3_11959 [Triticum urartu]